MTLQEAIRILDPKTTSEALSEIDYKNGFSGKEAVTKAVEEACTIAVHAMEFTEDTIGIFLTNLDVFSEYNPVAHRIAEKLEKHTRITEEK